jgi:hypothetical protein
MRKLPYAFVLAIAVFFLMPIDAYADDSLEVQGWLDFWWTVLEGNENGILQAVTQDPAVDEASGFNMKRGRLDFIFDKPESNIGGKFQLRLEEKVDILDFYIKLNIGDGASLYLGQMKVPSSYEAMMSSRDLDFISRSTLSSLITDWSLSRTSYFSSFYGNQAYFRDAGIGLKGKLTDDVGRDTFDYFFMVGNGLGHSLYIGGPESKEFLFSNKFGDYFYGLRLDWHPSECFTAGAHWSINNHDNVLFNDENTVFDLKRHSYSLDARYDSPEMRLTAMLGGGVIDDDYFHTGEKDLDYSGWELKAMVPFSDNWEGGLRYDDYSYKAHGAPNTTHQDNWTLGLNYSANPDFRIQINYLIKNTDDNINPDLDDNIFYVNFKYLYNSGNILAKKNSTAAKPEPSEDESIEAENASSTEDQQ